MNKNRPVASFCLTACVFVFTLMLAVPSRAQIQIADTSKPLIVKPAKVKNKPGKFWGEVLSANPKSIQVRSQQNNSVIRVFSYTPNASARMAQVLAKGGYHYGDKVVIVYAPGSDIALRIKGKPSKVG